MKKIVVKIQKNSYLQNWHRICYLILFILCTGKNRVKYFKTCVQSSVCFISLSMWILKFTTFLQTKYMSINERVFEMLSLKYYLHTKFVTQFVDMYSWIIQVNRHNGSSEWSLMSRSTQREKILLNTLQDLCEYLETQGRGLLESKQIIGISIGREFSSYPSELALQKILKTKKFKSS